MRYLSGLILLAVFAPGCATIMTGGGPMQSVRINSEPRGATVYADDNLIGKTPTIAELTRHDDHVVKVQLEGCPDQSFIIEHKGNYWIFGNVLFGGIIGIAVDCCTGTLSGTLHPDDLDVKFVTPPDLLQSPSANQ
jgi:hypothetical protein